MTALCHSVFVGPPLRVNGARAVCDNQRLSIFVGSLGVIEIPKIIDTTDTDIYGISVSKGPRAVIPVFVESDIRRAKQNMLCGFVLLRPVTR